VDDVELTRRRLLELGLALPVPFVLAACGGDGASEAAPTTSAGTTTEATTAPTATLAPTPACDDGDDPTPEQTEGPFFTPDSPERTSLREDGIDGTAFVLTGTVLATDCTPLAGALLDFWHADDSGEYDNEGYRLRGHQFTDANGAYRLETIVPGLYTGRTRHIHVKAQREGGDVLTTQLYFPDEPSNESDSIFDPALVMSRAGRSGARFDFVLV
jgi:protocatechuate 3,4-dioxygenase beta subunit